jgi:hypothetical protein
MRFGRYKLKDPLKERPGSFDVLASGVLPQVEEQELLATNLPAFAIDRGKDGAA